VQQENPSHNLAVDLDMVAHRCCNSKMQGHLDGEQRTNHLRSGTREKRQDSEDYWCANKIYGAPLSFLLFLGFKLFSHDSNLAPISIAVVVIKCRPSIIPVNIGCGQ
jgi:hypothetical protein